MMCIQRPDIVMRKLVLGINAGHWVWQQVLLSRAPSCHPKLCILKHALSWSGVYASFRSCLFFTYILEKVLYEQKNVSLKKICIFYVRVCELYVTWVQTLSKSRREIASPGSGVKGWYGSPNMCAGNKTSPSLKEQQASVTAGL